MNRIRRIRPIRPGDHGPLLDEGEGRLFATLPGAPAEGLTRANWRPPASWHAAGGALLPLVPALAAASWSAPAAGLSFIGAVLLALYATEAAGPALRRATLAIHAPFWDRLLMLAPEAFARLPVPILANRLNTALRVALADTVRADQSRRAALTLAGALALLGLASTPLALLALAILALAAPLIARCAARAATAAEAAGWRQLRAGARLAEVAPALPELRPLRAGGWATRRSLHAQARARVAAARAEARAREVILATAALPPVLALGLASATALGAAPGLSLADLIAALLAGLPAAHAAAALAAMLGQGRGLAPRLRAAERSFGPTAPADAVGGLPAPDFALLEARSLTFAWPGASAPIIENLSFTLKRGEVLALTGPSGGGKTTLMRLLLGLLTPRSGALLLNGEPIARYDPGPLRRRLSAVHQDESDTITTIREAAAGPFPLTEAEVTELLDLVGLTEAVAAMPMGLETLVLEGAFPATLLGRLRIARALAGRPDLLFLDESLAAFEADEATILLQRLRNQGLTLVLCLHDSVVARLADRVISMGEGFAS